MQKIFEKLRIEILKTLDDQNAGYWLDLQNSLIKSAKNLTPTGEYSINKMLNLDRYHFIDKNLSIQNNYKWTLPINLSIEFYSSIIFYR